MEAMARARARARARVSSTQSQMDGEASSTSPPVPRGGGGEYEVFLSFRGPDTRLTFTDFLYTNLDSVGVRTFRDDEELRKGEEIWPELLKAIGESQISIPIFSKNYASSKWCLRELAQMVDCKRITGQSILPIFYDVEPSEVRHQSGSYGEAFRVHETCFDEITLVKWREALKEVGALKGWQVNKEADGHQGQLVERIVQTVLLDLKKKYMDLTTDKLVMMDHHLNEMMKYLDVGSNDKRIVGIYGMGGIGKTTIAKFIYNQLLVCFDCSSFLADVRETVQQYKGVVDLQNQLLTDTLRRQSHITNFNDGIETIKHRFRKKKVLIVLDDVNEKSQFDWLVGNRDWFGPGTRIIVTTRNKHVLNTLEVNETYEPPFMNPEQSLQLLSIHAFRKRVPRTDYNGISRKVVSVTAGLPLALEVIGSFLSDKPKKIWEDTLKKLKNIPNDKVQEKLRVSYDELNHQQKQIFLDIATLFIGMDKTYPFYMWDECGYYPETEISVLCLMSLVKIDNDNVLKMHDQLRDLGRAIVCQENPENVGMQSRLWDKEEALDVLEGQTGTDNVQLLSLGPGIYGRPCDHYKFPELSNLRYLQVDGAQLVGDFKHHFSRLRWLRWQYCPPHFEATNFHMRKLVILDLSHSFITKNWNGWSQIKMVKNLKVLDISFTEIRELPDEIWMLKMLEIIDARHSRLTGNIPSDIWKLSSLRYINFNSTRIRSLPTSICKLSYLQTLDLGDCCDLETLPELPSCLEFLNVYLFKLHVIPNLANLVNLQELLCNYDNMTHTKLVEFFRGIDKLSNLQRLDFGFSNIMTLPKEIDSLSRLKILNLESCDELQCILGLPPSLVGLHIVGGQSLEILPDLSNLKVLQELTLYACHKLTKIQGLGKLESLRSLRIECCLNLKEIEGLGDLELLESLTIDRCVELTEIQGLGKLESLASFCIRWCSKIAELDLLECSASLASSLDLLECSASLASSEMSGYEHPENKPDLSNLNKLIFFEAIGCKNLNKIKGLHTLVSLEYLNLSDCPSIERLPNLSNLKMLRRFHSCMSSCEIEGLEALVALEELDITGCTSLEFHTGDLRE
ncbi:disease resistance protein L6-like isoform X2 [Cornus florida]|uniref:disease resistance protein L6-like isoform X2 n=1 Tax=Cornus florida TaxID=4283 RepID=UPI00289AD0D2|nr:disease resistance protein L6-like isoform X2 [Cornus florida]